jgi:hypothetical protein
MLTKLILGSVVALAMVFVGVDIAGKTQWTTDSEIEAREEGPASCCSVSTAQAGDKADCCKKNLACCDNGKVKACCVASAKLGCCDKSLKCCETNSACCSAVQECCREGAACCNESKACCGKSSAPTGE